LRHRSISLRAITVLLAAGLLGASTLSVAHADPENEADRILESITAAAPDLVANATTAPAAKFGGTATSDTSMIDESKRAKIGLPKAKNIPTRGIPLTEKI
jgi:hypothetical protein